eukprot:635448-Prymnesium_polylepis.1
MLARVGGDDHRGLCLSLDTNEIEQTFRVDRRRLRPVVPVRAGGGTHAAAALASEYAKSATVAVRVWRTA